ncbi:MAG: aminotransferase class V-fold PLP-dependent enzyme [Lachnospiraceae bacterium]|nr:aminotransferase class V-fold PLP-dependent enzyme [Lachnospiraceae bacterium]
MLEELLKLSDSDSYPFHMPGHKRRMRGFDPYSVDITEIDGFDDMHDPRGLIADLNERLRKRFGGDRAYILINGSTSGVLMAISSCLKPGEKLLMARNSHRSAYNALYLRNLDAVFLEPEETGVYGISGGISPEKTEEALQRDRDIGCVFITSPTYEGFVSDVKKIAEVCHSHGVPLIVDSAHGAHGGLYKPFTDRYGFENAALCSADIVIKSLHKTLPAFTQTALISISGKLADPDRLKFFYSLYQSSSPSYIFMAGVDKMLKFLDEHGEERFEVLDRELKDLRAGAYGNKRIRIFGEELMGKAGICGFDPTKILVSAEGLKGKELYDMFRTRYRLQPEMAAGEYVLLMTGIMDDEEGFRRLGHAIAELEKEELSSPSAGTAETVTVPEVEVLSSGQVTGRLKLSEAMDMKKERIALSRAKGRISAGFISLFPPGIPLIIPGEIFTEEITAKIEEHLKQGLSVKGLVS